MRVDYNKAAPEVVQAMMCLERQVERSGLERSLGESPSRLGFPVGELHGLLDSRAPRYHPVAPLRFRPVERLVRCLHQRPPATVATGYHGGDAGTDRHHGAHQ